MLTVVLWGMKHSIDLGIVFVEKKKLKEKKPKEGELDFYLKLRKISSPTLPS